MKTLAFVLMGFIPLSLHASEDGITAASAAVDRPSTQLIVKRSEMPDLQGGVVWLEQRVEPIGEDSFRYDYRQQSDETKAYHQAYCAQWGSFPALDGETTFTGASAAWWCGISITYGPDGEVWDDSELWR